MVNHDEYTDYSCSTSIERLSRDVETLLRSWHVVDSDRHVSFSHASLTTTNPNLNRVGSTPNLLAKTTIEVTDAAASTPKRKGSSSTMKKSGSGSLLSGMDHTGESSNKRLPEGRPHFNRAESVPRGGLYDSSSSKALLPPGHDDDPSVRLIRSSDVALTVSLSGGGGRVSIPLTLALWDGPFNHGHGGDFLETEFNIPQSLRRPPFTNMPTDPFANFSSLFGIGQHITLTSSSSAGASPEQHQQQPAMEEIILAALGQSVTQRHEEVTTSPWVMASILSGMLQTALNCAASNTQCRIPVFGLWGSYRPDQDSTRIMASIESMQHTMDTPFGGLKLFPTWIQPGRDNTSGSARWVPLSSTSPSRSRRGLFSSSKKEEVVNRNFCPPALAASLMPGSAINTSPAGAIFWLSVLPGNGQQFFASNNRLTMWGRVLLEHCPPSTENVVLCGARHVYTWLKPQKKQPTSLLSFDYHKYDPIQLEWRQQLMSGQEKVNDDGEIDVESYRRQCRHHAQELLEQAAGTSDDQPIWGPPDDPVDSVHVTVTWNGRQSDAVAGDGDAKERRAAQPLLTLPLRIRSRRSMSRSDWVDMEDSVERTILDPYQSSSFVVQTHYDRDTSLTSLAASQRCVLAALIRTATLHPETLIQHVTNETVLDEWSEEDGDTAVVDWLMNHAKVGAVTRNLVHVMNWTNVTDDMIDPHEAEDIVRKVLDGTTGLGFPSPPEEMFSALTEQDKMSNQHNDPFSPMLKSAPVGRFLSVLFLHMSRLRSPSSMAVVWLAFVRELRNRWDMRESLPNMGYIPGLDPPPEALNTKRCFSTLGSKADYAAFVHSSEPDPDDYYCLIGQKLQVFNLGIECTTALEMLEMERREQQQAQSREPHTQDIVGGEQDDGDNHAPSVASTEVINNIGGSPQRKKHCSVSFDADTPAMNSTLMSESASADADETGENSTTKHDGHGIDGKRGPIVDITPTHEHMGAIEEGHEQSVTSGSLSAFFYDAVDARSLSTADNACDVNVPGRESTANVTQRQNRKGARCPVHGVSLVASGDQLYAPYLQRPTPLTDDIILERRLMLSHRRTNGSADSKGTVHSRVEIAQRLQKSKLLSDMRAFQAANPGAVFQDFIAWYGNPGNPLDEYRDDPGPANLQAGEASGRSAAVKLDNASEAIQILTATRDFWSDTWDEATPCAAIEQQPLFDVFSTVEMVLDFLETMHPASLINQIMAVNLAMSYFVLVTSAGDAVQVGVVQSALQDLCGKTEIALRILSRDVTAGTCPAFAESDDRERLPKHASSEAIGACEIACDALAEAEALLSRAMALLHKFPQQYELVQTMLRRADGDVISLDTVEGRMGIMHAIHGQQVQLTGGPEVHMDSLPVPSLREYLLRNQDEDNPCQLCVRFGDERAFFDGIDAEGALLLALTKCNRD